MSFPFEAFSEPATTFTEGDETIASFSVLFELDLGSTAGHEAAGPAPVTAPPPAATTEDVEIAQEHGSFSEALLLGRTADGAKARVSFRDPDRQGMVFEVDPTLLRPARGHLRGRGSFGAGEAVEVYWPLRCTWFSAQVVEARADHSYRVQWACGGAESGTRVAFVSGAQLRPVHTVALGTLVEVRGGNGLPGARGSFYEVSRSNGRGKRRCCAVPIVFSPFQQVNQREKQTVLFFFFFPSHHLAKGPRGGARRAAPRAGAVGVPVRRFARRRQRGQRGRGRAAAAPRSRARRASIHGVDATGYTVRWKYDYGDGVAPTSRVKSSHVRKPMPLELKRCKKSVE